MYISAGGLGPKFVKGSEAHKNSVTGDTCSKRHDFRRKLIDFKQDDKIVIDNLKWNGEAKKSGFEIGDYISEFKIENSDRPSKNIVYPIAILLLVVFGYFNLKRKE